MARASACLLAALLGVVVVAVAASDDELLLGEALARGSRALLQSGTSCPQQIPGCMARRCTTRLVESEKNVYVCLRCKQGFVPVLNANRQHIMQCICPAGTFFDEYSTMCEPCPQGAYCPGGSKTARKPTDPLGSLISCGAEGVTAGITTKGERATKMADCVAEPGWVLDPQQAGVAVRCTGSSYAPANNRIRSCLRCQSGLEAPPYFAGDRTDRNQVCQVPPGRFWELNVVRDCPKGTYREYYVKVVDKAAIRCLPCPNGWTTPGIGTKTMDECNVLLAGYMVPGVDPGDELTLVPQDVAYTDAEECPMGFYYDATVAIYGCRKCPYGSTTADTGAKGLEECVVPPGYFLAKTDDPNQGLLTKCPGNVEGQGYYRPEWIGYKQAISQIEGDAAGSDICIPCGTGILSEPRQMDEIIDPDAVVAFDPYPGLVPALPESCYILAGWGSIFDPDNLGKLKAVAPCEANKYGVTNKTFGLSQAPCKACSQNLYSPEGSISYTACKNPGGFGYNSEGANQCAHDFWTPHNGMMPCIQCPPGRKTLYVPGDGQYQDQIEDCLIPPGFGVFQAKSDDPWAPANRTASMMAAPCPQNWFSPGDPPTATQTTNVMCQPCPAGKGTVGEGSSVCDACAPGYGIPSSKPTSTNVDDCEPCTCGNYHEGGGLRCSSCPTTVFNHPVGGPYTSQGTTFATGLTGPETCVPVHAQLPTPAGHILSIHPSVFSAATPAADVAACIQTCPPAMCCIAQFQEVGTSGECKIAVLPPVGPGYTGARLYYKLPPSELIAPASVTGEGVKAKTQASGIYTRCVMDTTWEGLAAVGQVGISANPSLVEETDRTKLVEWGECSSEATCQSKCERLATCWGFIYVPTKGWAIRGGEDQIDFRSFITSPDVCTPPVGPPEGGEGIDLPPNNCPPGMGGMFPCELTCPAGTYNDGNSPNCLPCPDGLVSEAGASICTTPVITTCPAGKQGPPACTTNCSANTYNDGTFGTCQLCPAGTVSSPGAGSCVVAPPTTCPVGYQGLPLCLNKCQSGTWNNGSYATCQPCPAGKVSEEGAATCTDPPPTSCPPGRQGLPSCNQLCAPGTFNPGAAVCLPCPAYMTSDAGASSCYYVTCPPGHSVLPNCTTHCTAGTFQDGTGSTCQPCPLNFNSGTASGRCYAMPLPAPSTCTPRPTTSSGVKFDCPTPSGVSWVPLAPSSATLPARCTAPPGISHKSCTKLPAGLFVADTEMVQVSDGSCACKDWEKGYIPAKPSGKNKVECVPGAMWLEGSGSAPGIWVPDVSANNQMCDGAQACWDMCFFCDGRPRYRSNSVCSLKKGTATVREFASSSCSSPLCALASQQTLSGTKSFASMCDNYRKNAGFAASGVSLYRPENTVANWFKVAASVPGGAADWGQTVLVKFGGVV